MMVGIVTYFLQVVVFTAYAQTFLTVCHTRVLDGVIAQDDTFPGVHTGIGEHQGGVIFDDHRRRRNDLMSLRCHKVQEGLSNLFTCHYRLLYYDRIGYHP